MGLDYGEEVLDPPKGDQFAPDYLALNPNAVVPTVVDGDQIMGELSLILEYLTNSCPFTSSRAGKHSSGCPSW